MKVNILILVLIILGTSAWTYFSNVAVNISSPSAAQEKVSDFKFKTLKGSEYSLSDYKEAPILLHFWATWCAPCLEELPKLIDLAQAQPKKLTIIAIAVADKESHIQRFLTKIKKPHPDNFIIGFDPEKTISKDIYGTIKLPETYIVTPNFTLLEKVTGAETDWNSRHWKNKITQLR